MPNIWLFDPERREAWIRTNEAMTKVTGEVLAAASTGIAIPLAEIWANLD